MIHVDVGQDVAAIVAAAPEGETIRLAAGRHVGPIQVTRRLTLEGERGAELIGKGRGTVLSILADDVTVRGLSVRGSGGDATNGDAGVLVSGADRVLLSSLQISDSLIGIDFRQADDGFVRDCTITGRLDMPLGQRGDGIRIWESHNNRVEHNTLMGVRDILVWYATGNFLANNDVSNARYGTHLMHANENTLVGNRYTENVVGIFVMYSRDIDLVGNLVVGAHGAAGMGIGFKESDTVRAVGNRLLGNTVGIYLDTTHSGLGGAASSLATSWPARPTPTSPPRLPGTMPSATSVPC